MSTSVSHSRGSFFCDTPTADDTDDLRRLQAMPMDGAVSLSLRAGPESRQAEALGGGRHHTVVVRRSENRRIVAMGTRSVMRVYLHGEPKHVGYLSGLRNTPGVRVPRGVVAEAFDRLGATRRKDEADFDFTSIMRDNRRARRGLERGVKGLPTYTPIGGLQTLALRVVGRDAVRPPLRRMTEADLPAVVELLEACGRSAQLRPVWDAATLACRERCRGLRVRDFVGYEEAGRLLACGAVWDQRAFKQTVVAGLTPALRRVRPIINAGCRLTGRVALPAEGEALSAVYASHLAVRDDTPGVWRRLVAGLSAIAMEKGAKVLVLGVPDDHRLEDGRALRRPVRRAASVLYAVHPAGSPAPVFHGRPVWPEVAVL